MLARIETMLHLQDPKKGYNKVGRLCSRVIRIVACAALRVRCYYSKHISRDPTGAGKNWKNEKISYQGELNEF